MTNEKYTELNEVIDRLEAKLDDMDKKIDEIVNIIDEYNKSGRIIMNKNDWEIMFKYKHDNDE